MTSSGYRRSPLRSLPRPQNPSGQCASGFPSMCRRRGFSPRGRCSRGRNNPLGSSTGLSPRGGWNSFQCGLTLTFGLVLSEKQRLGLVLIAAHSYMCPWEPVFHPPLSSLVLPGEVVVVRQSRWVNGQVPRELPSRGMPRAPQSHNDTSTLPVLHVPPATLSRHRPLTRSLGVFSRLRGRRSVERAQTL